MSERKRAQSTEIDEIAADEQLQKHLLVVKQIDSSSALPEQKKAMRDKLFKSLSTIGSLQMIRASDINDDLQHDAKLTQLQHDFNARALFSTETSGGDASAAILANQADEQKHPFLVELKDTREFVKRNSSLDNGYWLKTLRREVGTGKLPNETIVLLQFLLNPAADFRICLALLFECHDPAERMKKYQWYNAMLRDTWHVKHQGYEPEQYIRANGKSIQNCTEFASMPVVESDELEAKYPEEIKNLWNDLEQNMRSLMAYSAPSLHQAGPEVAGGALFQPRSRSPPNPYRKTDVSCTLWPAQKAKSSITAIIKGAGSIPLRQRPDGDWEAVTDEIEVAFGNNKKNVSALNKKVADLEVQLRNLKDQNETLKQKPNRYADTDGYRRGGSRGARGNTNRGRGRGGGYTRGGGDSVGEGDAPSDF